MSPFRSVGLCRFRVLTKQCPEGGGRKVTMLFPGGVVPGIALLYLQLYRVTCDQAHLLRSLDYVKRTLRNLSGRKVAFLCGDAGPLAVGAVVYHKLKSDCEAQECVTK